MELGKDIGVSPRILGRNSSKVRLSPLSHTTQSRAPAGPGCDLTDGGRALKEHGRERESHRSSLLDGGSLKERDTAMEDTFSTVLANLEVSQRKYLQTAVLHRSEFLSGPVTVGREGTMFS